LTVKDLANAFLNSKQRLVDAGELSPRTWACYKEACDAVVAAFGTARLVADLAAGGFARLRSQLAGRYGPHGLGVRIQCARSAFKFAFESGLTATPTRFGPGFKRPSKKTLRLHRARQGAKLFTAAGGRALGGGALVVGADGPELVRAGPQLRAMVLLGINCGLGNHDCGALPIAALDLDRGWLDYPRPKTGLARRAPLWSETVAALRDALAQR